MILNLLTNWLFLSVVSSVATALLIVLSSLALGGIHSSLIMVVRIIGVAIIVAPVAIYVVIKGNIGGQVIKNDFSYMSLLVAIAICAGISWYSFYLALEYAKPANRSAASVTAINYASVVLVLFIPWLFGIQSADWRNWLGVVLVVAGVYLTTLQPTEAATRDMQAVCDAQGK